MKTKIIIRHYHTAEDIIIERDNSEIGDVIASKDIEIFKNFQDFEQYEVKSLIRHRRRKPLGTGRYEDVKQTLICERV